jgi:hypothetical protein
MPRRIGATDPITGVADPSNLYVPGAFTVKVGPQQMGLGAVGEFECYHIAIAGPAGSNFQVYVGESFYDFVAHGDINSWDPSQPMKLTWGNTVYFYWSVGTGTPVPTVTMYFQEASAL